MGLFGNAEDKKKENNEALQSLMAKYGLENLSPEYREKVRDIYLEIIGTGAIEMAMKFNFGTQPEELLKVSYLNGILKQNWIIIRLLDEIKNK
jgi:hypothetical protein